MSVLPVPPHPAVGDTQCHIRHIEHGKNNVNMSTHAYTHTNTKMVNMHSSALAHMCVHNTHARTHACMYTCAEAHKHRKRLEYRNQHTTTTTSWVGGGGGGGVR